MTSSLTTSDFKGGTLDVIVTPKAARNRIACVEGRVKVYVTVVPEGGKANKAVLAFLAKELGVAKTRLSIVKGATARQKTIGLDL
ncbi:MAG: DUF167 domain-containing protein [Halocynthiibacter sp.]